MSDHAADLTNALIKESQRVSEATAKLFRDGWRPLHIWSPPSKPGDEVMCFMNQTWVRRKS